MPRDVWKYVGTVVILDRHSREMLMRKRSFACDDVFEVLRMLENFSHRFSCPGNSARITVYDCNRKINTYQLSYIF